MSVEKRENPLLAGMSGEEMVVRLCLFLELVDQANKGGVNYPELEAYRRFNLYDPKHPDKSWLHQQVSKTSMAGEYFKSLLSSGQLVEGFDQVVRDEAQSQILGKRRRSVRNKKIYRGLRTFSKGLALLGQIGGESTPESYVVSVGIMFGLWGVIDRALADPDERVVANMVALAETLQRIFKEPENRSRLSARSICELTLGTEANPAMEMAIDDWQDKIAGLLDAGVAPKAIFEILERHWLHTPVRRSVATAKEKIMEEILYKMNNLVADDSVGEWSTSEAIRLRREGRLKLAEQAALLDLPEKIMPKITWQWLLGFGGENKKTGP